MRIGSYKVVRELARGAMGVVYVARHDELERDVALKVMLSGGKKIDPKLLKRFELEATTVAQLNHPNIVRIHEVGKDDKDNPYLVMDLIEGDSLYHRLKQQGPLDGKEAAGLAKTLAEALEHAHERKILHRDVKPANVLLSPDGAPHLTDFGLARDEGHDDQRLTHQGQWLGTPGYMPPEQAKGQLDKIDRRADVYGLGATLFAMLSGRPPFEGKTEVETLKAVTVESAPRLSTLRAGVDAELEAICTKCLHKEPADRYPTAQALADDLDRYLRDEPVEARPARAGDRIGKWVRRNRAVVVTAGLAVLLLSGVALAFYGLVLRPEQEAQAELAAHESWAGEILEPWALGTLPDVKLEESIPDLVERLTRLEAAVDRVGAGTHRQAVAHLSAAVRLRQARAGATVEVPDAPDTKRDAADLVVDALLLFDRGDSAAARRRLDLALQRQRGLPAAKFADLHLQAALDPSRFLIQASSLSGDAAGLARRLAPRAVSVLFGEVFTSSAESAAPLSRTEMRRLNEAREHASTLGVETQTLIAAKQDALEASASAWRAALDRALPKQRELSVLRKLTILTKLDPPTRPGPQVRALLDACLRSVLDDEHVGERNTDAAYRRAQRVARVDHEIFYRLDPRRRYPARMHDVLRAALSAQVSATLDPKLTLACLRYGAFLRLQTGRSTEPLTRLLALAPTSRLRRSLVWRTRIRRRSANAELTTRASELQALLSGGLDDLSPRYWPGLVDRLLSVSHRTSAARRRQLGAQALAMLRASRRALIDRGHRAEQAALLDALLLETKATSLMKGGSAELQSYGTGAEFLRRHLSQVKPDARPLIRGLLARFLVRYGKLRSGRFGQREQAIKLFYEALEHGQGAVGFADRWQDGRPACVLSLARSLRALGRAPEAWRVIQRHADASARSDTRMVEMIVDLLADMGRFEEARVSLRQGMKGARGGHRRLLEHTLQRLNAREAEHQDEKKKDDGKQDGDEKDPDSPPPTPPPG